MHGISQRAMDGGVNMCRMHGISQRAMDGGVNMCRMHGISQRARMAVRYCKI